MAEDTIEKKEQDPALEQEQENILKNVVQEIYRDSPSETQSKTLEEKLDSTLSKSDTPGVAILDEAVQKRKEGLAEDSPARQYLKAGSQAEKQAIVLGLAHDLLDGKENKESALQALRDISFFEAAGRVASGLGGNSALEQRDFFDGLRRLAEQEQLPGESGAESTKFLQNLKLSSPELARGVEEARKQKGIERENSSENLGTFLDVIKTDGHDAARNANDSIKRSNFRALIQGNDSKQFLGELAGTMLSARAKDGFKQSGLIDFKDCLIHLSDENRKMAQDLMKEFREQRVLEFDPATKTYTGTLESQDIVRTVAKLHDSGPDPKALKTESNQAGDSAQAETRSEIEKPKELKTEIRDNNDGSKTISNENGSLTINRDGSQLVRNAKGAILATLDGSGKRTLFEPADRGPEDQPTKITFPNGNVLENVGENTWKSPGTSETLNGAWQLDKNGDLSIKDSKSAESLTHKVDGSTVMRNSDGNVVSIRDRDGREQEFKWNEKKELVGMKLADGSHWQKLDGEAWLKEGSTEIMRGSFKLDSDGSLHHKSEASPHLNLPAIDSVTRTDGWTESKDAKTGKTVFERENLDGSHVVKNEKGQLIEVRDARGQSRHFEYDSKGEISRMITPGASAWSTSDGLNWSRDNSKPPETWKGVVGIADTGIYVEGTADSSSETLFQGDGSSIKMKNGEVVERKDGLITSHADTGLTERRDETGSRVFTNDKSQILKVVGKDGKVSEYSYGPSGELTRFKNADGDYSTKDGLHWESKKLTGENSIEVSSRIGKFEVMKNGTLKETDPSNGVERYYLGDGSVLVQDRGTVKVVALVGGKERITETVDAKGYHLKFGYGEITRDGSKSSDQLTCIEYPDGRKESTNDGIHWKGSDGTERMFSAVLHADGAFQNIFLRGDQNIHRLDCVERPGDHSRRADLEASVKSMVDALSFSMTTSYAHRSKVVQDALAGRPAAEVQIIKHMFEKSWGDGTSMEAVLKERLGATYGDKGVAQLKRFDDGNFGEVKDDPAGRIFSALGSKNGELSEKEVRMTLSRLNAERIGELKADYKNRFNEDLTVALGKLPQSDYTKAVINAYMKGNDHVTEHEKSNLLFHAFSSRNISQLGEAASLASEEARESFIQAQGGKAATELLIMQNFGGTFSNIDAYQAKDYLFHGRLTEARLIRENIGTFSTTDGNIEKVLSEMSDERRSMFFQGEYLSANPGQIKTEADRKAVGLYHDLSSAFREAYSWASDLRVAQLRDQVRTEGGGLVKEVGKHGGTFFADGIKDIAKSIHNMSPKQWDAIVSDPQAFKRLELELKPWLGEANTQAALDLLSRKVLHKMNLDATSKTDLAKEPQFSKMSEADLGRYLAGREQSQKLVEAALDPVSKELNPIKLRALESELKERALSGDKNSLVALDALQFYKSETFKAVKAEGRRSVLDSIDDASSDPKAVIDAILHMTADERAQYLSTNVNFHSDLRDKVNTTLASYPEAHAVAKDLLEQIWKGGKDVSPKLSLIDQLQMMKYESGAESISRVKVLGVLEKAFADDPTLRQSLLQNKDFAAQFKEVVSKIIPMKNQERAKGQDYNYNHFVKPLIENGRLTAQEIDSLHRFGSAQTVAEHVAKLNIETLASMNRNPEEKAFLLATLDAENGKVVKLALEGSSVLLASKNAFLNTVDVGSRSAVEQIIQQGGARTAEEKLVLQNLQKSGTDMKALENLISDWKDGALTPADHMRLFVLNPELGAADVKEMLASMSLDERQHTYSEYAARYEGHDLQRDLLDRAEQADRPELAFLLRTAQLSGGTRFGMAFDAASASDGWSSGIMRLTGYAGSVSRMREDLSGFHKALAAASADGKSIEPAELNKLEQYWRDSLVNLHGAKEQLADSIVNTAITVGAVAGAAFTGGASLYPVLYGAIAGASLKLGTHMLVSGADFEMSMANVSNKIVSGMFHGGFMAVTPGHLGALVLGKAAAGKAAVMVTQEFTLAGKELSQAGQKVLAAEMEKMVGNALGNGAAGVTEKELFQTARAVLAKEVGLDPSKAKFLTEALTKSMSRNLQQAIVQESKTFIQTAQNELFHTVSNAAIGGTAALTGAATENVFGGHGSEADLVKAFTEGGLAGFAMSSFARGFHYTSGRALAHSADNLPTNASLTRLRTQTTLEYGNAVLSTVGSAVLGGGATQIVLTGKLDAGALAESSIHLAAGSSLGGLRNLFGKATPTRRVSEGEGAEAPKKSADASGDGPARAGAAKPGAPDTAESIPKLKVSSLAKEGDGNANENPLLNKLDHAFQQLKSKSLFESAIGALTGSNARQESAVKTLMTDYIRGEAKRMGLPADAAKLLETKLLAMKEGGGGVSADAWLVEFNKALTGVQVKSASEVGTHEVRHAVDLFIDTVLYESNPEAYVKNLVDGLIAQSGTGGKISHGILPRLEARANLNEADLQLVRSVLRENLHKCKTLPEINALRDLDLSIVRKQMEGNPAFKGLSNQKIEDLARETLKELFHISDVADGLTLDPKLYKVGNNPQLKAVVDAVVADMKKQWASGEGNKNLGQYLEFRLEGASVTSSGKSRDWDQGHQNAWASNYNVSPNEMRAFRAQESANLELLTKAADALKRASGSLKDDPEISAIYKKLQLEKPGTTSGDNLLLELISKMPPLEPGHVPPKDAPERSSAKADLKKALTEPTDSEHLKALQERIEDSKRIIRHLNAKEEMVRSLWRMNLADNPEDKAGHKIRMEAAAKRALELAGDSVEHLKMFIEDNKILSPQDVQKQLELRSKHMESTSDASPHLWRQGLPPKDPNATPHSVTEIKPGNLAAVLKDGVVRRDLPSEVQAELKIEPAKAKAIEQEYSQYMTKLKNAMALAEGPTRETALKEVLQHFDKKLAPALKDAGIDVAISTKAIAQPVFNQPLQSRYLIRGQQAPVDLNTVGGLRQALKAHPQGQELFRTLMNMPGSEFSASMNPNGPALPGTESKQLSPKQKQALASAVLHSDRADFLPFLGLRKGDTVPVSERILVKAEDGISPTLAAFNRAEEVTHFMQMLNNGNLSKSGDLVAQLFASGEAASSLGIKLNPTEVPEHDFIGVLREFGIEPPAEMMDASHYNRADIERLLVEKGLLDSRFRTK